MSELVKKLHIYSGLSLALALLLFGVVGVAATFWGHAEPTPLPARMVDFDIDQTASDYELVQAAFAQLAVPNTGIPPAEAVARNPQGELRFSFGGPNGMLHVFINEAKKRLEVIEEPSSLTSYLVTMHATLPIHAPRRFAIFLWSTYIELGIFGLLGLSVSGVYLWLCSRPRLRWAQFVFVGGTLASAALMVWVS